MEHSFIFGEAKERIDEKDQLAVIPAAFDALGVADEIVMSAALMRPMKAQALTTIPAKLPCFRRDLALAWYRQLGLFVVAFPDEFHASTLLFRQSRP